MTAARTSGRWSVDQSRSIAPNPTDTTSTTDPTQDDASTPITGLNLFLLNTGSVARDHLASERTYLAYVRTSLALAMAGVALSQLLRLGERTKPSADIIGSLGIIIGIVMLIMGTRRFFLIQRSLVNGNFPPSSFEMISITFIFGSLLATTLGIIL